MIKFYDKSKIYNKIISKYLQKEIFYDNEIEIGEKIECYFPTYLYREQYNRCIEIFNDLYEWSNDKFYHELTPFHEIGLYYFLKDMNSLKNDIGKEFIKIFYDADFKKEIDSQINKDIIEFKEETGKKASIKYFQKFYYDPFYIIDAIFEDVDFLELPYLYNEYKYSIPVIADRLGINLDYYFEILPIDIKKKYKSNHITLVGEIGELFNYIQKRITYGSLYELFWENNLPIKETKIHTIIENIMDAYFIGKNVDISREAILKNGKVDFKIFRSNKTDEKVLVEVKKAKSSYLKSGYETQLCDYLKYSDYKNAFYLIVCFTDREYEIAMNFINKNIYTDQYQMYINISILDVRKNAPPSKKKKTSETVNSL